MLAVSVETLSRLKSLGQLVMGLRIVWDDGGSIRFRHAFIRGMLAVLEIYLLPGLVHFRHNRQYAVECMALTGSH